MRISAFTTTSLAFVLALAASEATAQDSKPAAAPATPAASAASMPMDCGPDMKRQDDGTERNAPSTTAMPCAPKAAASGAKAKAKPLHDHGKFHKNQ